MAEIKLLKIGSDGIPLEFDSAADAITLSSFSVAAGGPVMSATGIDMNAQKIVDLANGVASSDAVNKGQLDAAVTAAGGDLAAEIADRIQGDLDVAAAAASALSSAISTEVTNRNSAISSAIASDASAWAAADVVVADNAASALSSAISTEVSNRNTAIDSAVTTLKGGVSTTYDTLKKIGDKVDWIVSNADGAAIDSLTEILTAFNAGDSTIAGTVSALNTTLRGLITDEENARITADGVVASDAAAALSTAISTEVSNRNSAISTAVSTEHTAMLAAVSAEADLRIAEDALFLKLDGSRAMSGALDMGSNLVKGVTSMEAAQYVAEFTAGEALSARQVVYVSAADKVSKAKGDAAGTSYAVGFAQAGAAANATVKVIESGHVSGFSGMTPGALQYLSPSTAGALTEVLPGSGKRIVLMGIAKSATELKIFVQHLGVRA